MHRIDGSNPDTRFAGDVATTYADRMVPLFFAPFAQAMAARVAASAPVDVLETAAGTGVLTRALAQHMPGARIVATDLNAPMLDVARGSSDAAIEWRVADALQLPFDAASFDAVACQFGVMFYPDRIAAHCEARRVLRPQGRSFFSVWDAVDANPLVATVCDAIARRHPIDPPTFLARVPHGYHDVARIESDLRDAGFRHIAIERVTLVARADSARDVAIALCAGTPLRHELEARDADGLDAAIDAVRAAIAARFGDARIEAPMRAIFVEAGA